MTVRLSSGLRSAMITEYGLGIMMNLGRILIYTGQQPESADNPPTGQLIGFVSQEGVTPIPNEVLGGLRLKHGSIPGSLENDGNWVLRGTATGTAGWWRFVWNVEDDGTLSNFLPRIDGAVGESLILASPAILPVTGIPIQSFKIILPFQ